MQGSIVEGLANDSSNKCDLTDPNNLFNAVQWNASEISVLKQRIAELENIQTEVTDLSSNMVIVKEQIHGLIAQQQQAATQLVGNKPLTVTGAGYS
jgi:hypothetical protein